MSDPPPCNLADDPHQPSDEWHPLDGYWIWIYELGHVDIGIELPAPNEGAWALLSSPWGEMRLLHQHPTSFWPDGSWHEATEEQKWSGPDVEWRERHEEILTDLLGEPMARRIAPLMALPRFVSE
jgi:hypothetical protein